MKPHDLAIAAEVLLPIGLFAWMIWSLKHRGRVFPCPVCQKNVEREALLTDGVLCPHCGWYSAPVLHAKSASNRVAPFGRENETCAACEKLLAAHDAVSAWDGKTYCRNCVESASPELLSEMLASDRLDEKLEISPWQIRWKAWRLFWGIAMALFGIPFLCVGAAQGLHGIMMATLATLFFVCPIPTVFALVHAHAFINRLPSVTLKNGMLTVRTGNEWSTTHPLNEYEWFRGNLSMMSSRTLPLAKGPAIVLVVPQETVPQKKRFNQDNFKVEYATVGYTDQKRMLWEKLLTLAGVKHREDLELQKSWRAKFAEKVGPVLLLPLAFAFGMLLMMVFYLIINWLTGDEDIAEVVGVFALMHGSMYLIFFATVNWPKEWKAVPERNSYVNELSTPWVFRIAFLSISCLMGLVFAFWDSITLLEKAVTIPAQFPVSFLLGYDLDRRVRRQKNQNESSGRNASRV